MPVKLRDLKPVDSNLTRAPSSSSSAKVAAPANGLAGSWQQQMIIRRKYMAPENDDTGGGHLLMTCTRSRAALPRARARRHYAIASERFLSDASPGGSLAI